MSLKMTVNTKYPSTYQVGSRFPSWKPNMGVGFHYNYANNTHSLILIDDGLTPQQVIDFEISPMDFHLRVDSGLICMVIHVGTSYYGNAFFSWWANSEDNRSFPQIERNPQQRSIVTAFMVEHQTGILKAIRTFTWSPEFCRTLEFEIRRQASHPEYDDWDWYNRTTAEIYKKYPDITDMLDEEVLVISKAGE
jgi:hypothetical protein